MNQPVTEWEGLAPNWGSIPPELQQLSSGVWKAEPRDNGKVAKAPRDPGGGRNLSTKEPERWSDFAACRAAVEQGKFNGVGVLMRREAGIVAIDLDTVPKLIKKHPEVKALVKRARDEGFYIEKSPSGNGLHIFVRGTMETDGTRKGPIEIYTDKRFMTVTGGVGAIQEGQWLIDELLAIIGRDQGTGGNVIPLRPDNPEKVAPEVVSRVAEAVAKKQPSLWAGLWEATANPLSAIAGAYESQSDADFALCCEIARVALDEGVADAQLAKVVEEVFGRSGLVREKWTDRSDYRERTIDNAIAAVMKDRPTGATAEADDGKPDGDIKASQIFASQMDGKLRYVADRKQWCGWDGTCWKSCEQDEHMEHAKGVAGAIFDKATELYRADPDRRKVVLKFASRYQNIHGLEAMVKLAWSDPRLRASSGDFDSDPDLLCVQNGYVDLRTGELKEPDPSLLMARQAGASYELNASCQRWQQFLAEVFEGDRDVITFMQRAAGYSSTGHAGEEKMFVCYGLGANGKSIFGNVLTRLLGGYVNVAPPSLLVHRGNDTGPRDDLAHLCGSRVVQINELQSGDRLHEQTVKLIAGREKIAARFLYGRQFEFLPTFTPWLRTNHRPIITGDDDGIWRRLVLIAFKRKFGEHEQDPRLEEKLWSERDGILAWVIEGAVDWYRHGLQIPMAIQRESNGFRSESDVLGQFLDDCTVRDSAGQVEQIPLWKMWRDRCQSEGFREGTKNSFSRRLKERGFESSKSGSSRFYTGLTLIGSQGGAQTSTP